MNDSFQVACFICMYLLSSSDTGSCIIQLLDETLPFYIAGWRGTRSLRAYIALDDSIHYLRILGEDVSAFGM